MIDEGVKRLATGPNFGTITTLLGDGSPATHVMWVDADDEHVLINTETGRAKYRNVKRDPRVTVTIWNSKDEYDYVEVRGEVEATVTGSEAREHIDALSMKYQGKPYSDDWIETERVILKIRPTRQRS
ncbi:MAG: hypothetical protein QOG16_1113 [Actinomycetota bacterium]|nr:hypothetical protein [Actinomycetota bacterium]